MIDDSCEVPREDLDDGFNPCRKQVVENGELCQYAHMYDVMNERYDREEDTSYLNSVKRDRITQSTPSQTVGEGKLYAQDAQGVEGFVKSSETLDPTANGEIPSSKAVADYAPIPLPVSKGGTGGNTPYVTDDLDASAIFVMHDAPNDRYDAAPMSALTGYLDGRYESFGVTSILPNTDLNNLTKLGKYGTSSADVTATLTNKPDNITHSFVMEVGKANASSEIYQRITELVTLYTYERFIDGSGASTSWILLYPTPSSTVPNPLPVDQGGTGAQTRSLKTAAGLTLLPVIDSIGASGALNGYTSVTNIATFITTNKIRPEITAAFENHIADAVADNDLLPTNALMIDYVAAHSLNTPPSPFSYQVAPYPSGTWEGEMTVNVVPVFSVTIGAVEYIIARLYGAKKFNYNGPADNISLFSSIQIVEEYPYIFKDGTSIPLALSIQGRSYAAGTYGFNPRGSGSEVLLNDQTVSSVLSSANLNMSNSLNCVFGTGTNTPGVTVSFNCLTLMWRNLS